MSRLNETTRRAKASSPAYSQIFVLPQQARHRRLPGMDQLRPPCPAGPDQFTRRNLRHQYGRNPAPVHNYRWNLHRPVDDLQFLHHQLPRDPHECDHRAGFAGSNFQCVLGHGPGHALGLGPDPAVDYPGRVLVLLGVSRAPVPSDGLLTVLEHLRIKTAYLHAHARSLIHDYSNHSTHTSSAGCLY